MSPPVYEMLLLFCFFCFSQLCFGIPSANNLLKTSYDSSVYSIMRNVIQDIVSLDPPSFQQKKRMSEPAGPEGAVPFWFQGNRPHIHLWVGSPPQRVMVTLDTGSGYTWVHGPPSNNQSSDLQAEFFDSGISDSWQPQNASYILSYLDSSSCVATEGLERVSLSRTGSNFEILMGVESNSRCNTFRHGVLGLDRSSDLLKAFSRNQRNLPSVFSLSFKDEETGEGGNWFSLGGYAGLEPAEIYWMPQVVGSGKNDPTSSTYKVALPYLTYNEQRWNFKRDHAIIVDTGASIGILPSNVWKKMLAKVSTFPATITSNHNITETLPIFNLTSIPLDNYPTMALRMGDTEWLAEMCNLKLNIATNLGLDGVLSLPSFLPDEMFRDLADWKYVPSVLGSPFWSNLKGLIFDFTPGRERVGFVPRHRIINKNGLINPMFHSSVSSGGRPTSKHISGEKIMTSKYFWIANFVSFLLVEWS